MVTSLWRDKTSGLHFLGSVHYLPAGVALSLPPQCHAAYDRSGVIAVEARNDSAPDQSLSDLPVPLTLQKLLPKELFGLLEESAATLNVDLKRYASLRPFAIAFNIYRSAMAALGASAAEGVDSRLLKLASADRKRVVGLEDLNYGYRRFVESGFDTEIEYLRMVLDSLPNLKEANDSLVEAWRIGNIRTLEESRQRDMESYPLVMRILQTERNKNWLPAIESLRRESEAPLIVVGVHHLVGEGSLLDLLGQDKFEQE